MVKVFLVEDEIVVREGIKNNMNWVDNGFVFCGEASDGELAYPMIQKKRPDIVITDIRMPFMDGLELSRLIKREMPEIKIIILSGYGEFEYAKEAITIGVTEYLLKPINSVELMKCLNDVRESILREQEERINLEKLKQDMKENEADEKRKLFNEMISNLRPLSHILQKGKELNLELSSLYYNIVLFNMSLSNHIRGGYSSILLEVQQELEGLLEGEEKVIQFDYSVEGMAFLFKGDSLDDLKQIQDSCIQKIKKLMNAHSSISYFGGIGKPVNRLGQLYESFHEANRVFACRYVWDINEIPDISAIDMEHACADRSVNMGMVDTVNVVKKKVEGFLKSGDKGDIQYFVDEYFNCVDNTGKDSILFRQYMVMDIYFIVVGFLEQLGYKDNVKVLLKDIPQIGLQVSYLDSSKGYVEEILERAMELRDEVATKQYNSIILKAKEYIRENFTNEDISLNEVSSSVCISPSHFSTIFSQNTGQTFIKYLTDMRMNRAKELLKCTDMKSSEIAYSVGYRDPHYFSYLFKKTQNCTPKQYRYNVPKMTIEPVK